MKAEKQEEGSGRFWTGLTRFTRLRKRQDKISIFSKLQNCSEMCISQMRGPMTGNGILFLSFVGLGVVLLLLIIIILIGDFLFSLPSFHKTAVGLKNSSHEKQSKPPRQDVS